MSTAAQSGPERYAVEKQIGKGAYGVAYLCKHKGDGRRCVLKKVRLAKLSHLERQASLTELLILSNISHRNVLQYQEAWVEAGCIACMVVELCECGDLMTQLKARIPQQQYFKEQHLQDMLVQLASCLHFLHTNNIAHRDLKSSNVFITGGGCLKLADFGLATILDPEHPVSTTMVGTPNYMCPEILKEQPYGVKNDIWALGCVMFELSALKPAFQAFNMEGLTKKITSGPTPHVPSHYSEEWKEVVRALLSKDEEQRPTAADILQLDWLQAATRRVEERFGPAMPFVTKQRVQITDLPAPIAKLAQQFEKQERDAELKAAEEKAHFTELQAKYAPNALKARMEVEKKKAEAEVAAVRAKLGDKQPPTTQPLEPRPPSSAVGRCRASSELKVPATPPSPPEVGQLAGGGRGFMVRRASSDTLPRHPPPGSARSRHSLNDGSPPDSVAARERGMGPGVVGLLPSKHSRSISPVPRLSTSPVPVGPLEATAAAAGGRPGSRGHVDPGSVEERKAVSCPSLRRIQDYVAPLATQHAPVHAGVSQSVDLVAVIAAAAAATGPRAPPHGRPPLAPHGGGGNPLRTSASVVPSREAWGASASPSPAHSNDPKGSANSRQSSGQVHNHQQQAPARPPSRGFRAILGMPAAPIPRRHSPGSSTDGSEKGHPHPPGRKSETNALAPRRANSHLDEPEHHGTPRKEVQERRATLTGM